MPGPCHLCLGRQAKPNQGEKERLGGWGTGWVWRPEVGSQDGSKGNGIGAHHLAGMSSCTWAKEPKRWSVRKALPYLRIKSSMACPHQRAWR